MKYHLPALSAALRAAGLPGDCASDGRVDFGPGDFWRPGDPVRDERCKIAAAVLAAHDCDAACAAEAAAKANEARVLAKMRTLAEQAIATEDAAAKEAV